VRDFLVLLNDGHGPEDPLHLIVEIKGYRGEDAKTKRETMDVYWVPGVNNLGTHGRWAFVELTNLYQMEADFEASLTPTVNQAFEAFAQSANAGAKHA
jgi:type III restriction enzyme